MEGLSAGDPQHIGDYWLAGRLGAGGQGVVYEAYDTEGNRVAVKVLHPSREGGGRDRFAKEATAAGRVASFCTARVLATDLEAAKPYIVSEYVPGQSLRQAVEGGRRFAGDDLHRLATAVATALTAIHDAGVIHRDLKPDNVLLGPDGPRVIDFGIARTLDMSLTKTGEVAGTPSYMAPEVFTGQRAGPAADVFAWGAVMVFAATGQDPFAADNLGGVMHRVLSARPDLDGLPSRLASLVSAAMEKDPAARPAARDLLLALVSGNGTDTGGLLAAGSRAALGVRAAAQGDPALGTIAEDAYGALAPEERDLAAELFLRMVAIGDDGHETARWVPHDELFGGRPEPEVEAIRRVLRAFSYVVTSTETAVTLSRPGLLRAWPRLRTWLDADRDGLTVLAQITSAAGHWAGNGRHDGDLLQGSRLERALSWAATGRRHVTLTPRERDFLRAGSALTRRRARRRTMTTVALAALLAVALAAGGLAAYQRQQAAGQRDVLLAEQVAGGADRMRTTDPVKAMLLSVAAWRVSPGTAARSSLMSSLQQQETAAFRDPPVIGIANRALSGDGRTLVSVSEAGVNVFDVRTGRRTGGWSPLGLKGEILQDPVLNRSGSLLAQTTGDEVGVWDLASGRQLLRKPLPQAGNGGLYPVFGANDSVLTLKFADDIYRLLDVKTGKMFGKGLYGTMDLAQTPLVDPTGRHLLLTGERFDERALPGWTTERRYPACHKHPSTAAFTPDGKTLACADSDIVLVHAATGREFDRREDGWDCDICTRGYTRLRFGPGADLLMAFEGRDIRVWKVSTRQEILTYRAEADLTDAALDPDGRTLRYLMDDQVVSVDLAPRLASTRVKGDAEFSPEGQWAVLGGSEAKQTELWDLRLHRVVARFAADPNADTVRAFDRAGTRLLMGGDFGKIQLWDLVTRKRLWSIPAPRKDTNPVYAAEFSPDGRTIAVTLSPSGQTGPFWLLVFDTATGRTRYLLPTLGDGGPFTPDGKELVARGGRFIDIATGKPVGPGYDWSYATNAGAVISSRGLMARSEDTTGRIALWDARGSTARQPALPRAAGEVGGLDFSPDGGLLATYTTNGMLQLWDVAARQRLGGAFNLHDINVGDLGFSADGGTLYAAIEGTVFETPVDPGRVAAAVCRRAGRTLSAAEWDAAFKDVPYLDVCPQ
ncbi:WD40 repeat domain-containing serine/threonine-protein kinase [Nonomuraea sp. NPDC049141]|uniref:WD40 repeat domain-containing serine/threonine-protein kinase n=1 Tax=Nonomuraea sp. NPDC049141 TaxID=3155500 RepID=UPI003408F9BB